MIYLDNCATTKPRKEVIDFLSKTLEEDFSNPSSLHNFGMRTENLVEEQREIIGDFLNVKKENIFFTSGGTESNNLFIHGAIEKNKNLGRKIITSSIEHPAVDRVFNYYKELGYEVVKIGNDNSGELIYQDLEDAIDDETILVSIMHVNNELGTINNIKRITNIIKNKNPKTLFHVDGVQAFGKIKVDLSNLGVDAYSISGHKIHAIKGIGCLYIRDYSSFPPLLFGGNQEMGIRSGTENTPGIFALGKAVEILRDNFDIEEEHKKNLRNMIIETLENEFKDYVINTPIDNSPSSIINISFLDTRGEVLLHYLERDNIFISTSSACSSNSKEISNLEKLGKSKNEVEGSIRICLSYENTAEDIREFLDKLKIAVDEMRIITKRLR